MTVALVLSSMVMWCVGLRMVYRGLARNERIPTDYAPKRATITMSTDYQGMV